MGSLGRPLARIASRASAAGISSAHAEQPKASAAQAHAGSLVATRTAVPIRTATEHTSSTSIEASAAERPVTNGSVKSITATRGAPASASAAERRARCAGLSRSISCSDAVARPSAARNGRTSDARDPAPKGLCLASRFPAASAAGSHSGLNAAACSATPAARSTASPARDEPFVPAAPRTRAAPPRCARNRASRATASSTVHAPDTSATRSNTPRPTCARGSRSRGAKARRRAARPLAGAPPANSTPHTTSEPEVGRTSPATASSTSRAGACSVESSTHTSPEETSNEENSNERYAPLQ